MTPETWRILVGLMLGMFVSSISMTIVSPALPRIVAELGGMAHYSWLATSTMLVQAIVVPIGGKLSDMYGRRPFYLGGLVVFMLGSALSGLATSFGFLIAARCLQGLGMGVLMPLSQTIIGDIIPPRQRGKYQGFMGAVFGVSSVAGPIVGGWVTDNMGWRPLFYLGIPFGLVAFFFIARFLNIPQERIRARIDFAGIATLSLAMTSLLLATSLGGSSLPWASWQIIAMYVFGVVMLAAFIFAEKRAEEPLIPLRIFRNTVVTLSAVASFLVAMAMFVVIIYVPVFAQGAMGVSATESGLVMIPMNISLIGVSILVGILITRTGHYKEFVLFGLVLMMIGMWLLGRVDVDDPIWRLALSIAVFGLGLGMALQQYVLMVQNAVMRRDLGVATASNQFVRTIGQVVGIAVAGTVMNSGLARALPHHLPAEAAGNLDAGSVLDPQALATLPPEIAQGVRFALNEAMDPMFYGAILVVVATFVVTVLIPNVPLRDSVHSAEDQGREMLDAMAQSSSSGDHVPLGRAMGRSRTGERLLGLQMALFIDQAQREDRPLLRQAVMDLGDGDFERGVRRLYGTSRMLVTEDPAEASETEEFAIELAANDKGADGILSPDLRARIVQEASSLSYRDEEFHGEKEQPVHERYEGVKIDNLRRIGNELTAALMVDMHRHRPSSE